MDDICAVYAFHATVDHFIIGGLIEFCSDLDRVLKLQQDINTSHVSKDTFLINMRVKWRECKIRIEKEN